VGLQVRTAPASDLSLDEFLDLSAMQYAGLPVNDPSYVRWRHLESPTGPSTAVEILSESIPVGRIWIQLQEWSIGGRRIRAANPIDFLIRQDHRSLNAFLKLFRAAMAEAQRQADVVLHTSNPTTDQLFRKLLKYEAVTELDAAVTPARPFAVASAMGWPALGPLGSLIDAFTAGLVRILGRLSRLSGVHLSEGASREEQDAIVARFLVAEPVCGFRSPEYRSWRFQGAGPVQYRQSWVRREGRAIGYVVTTDRDLNGIRARFVVDVVLPGRERRLAVAAVWLQLAAEAARDARDSMFFFYNRTNPTLRRLARYPPWFTVPRARLPQRVPIFVRRSPVTGADPFPEPDWASGYYVLADLDLV
jgi:hypothetical protein